MLAQQQELDSLFDEVCTGQITSKQLDYVNSHVLGVLSRVKDMLHCEAEVIV